MYSYEDYLGFIIGLPLIGMGLLFIVREYIDALLQIRSKFWKQTIGKVISSKVTELEDAEGIYGHEPCVEYEYVVDDVTYRSTRRIFGDSQYRLSEANDCVSFYPAGLEVTVYYDPVRPSDSVLERKRDLVSVKAGTGLGMILIIMGCVLLYLN